MTPLNELLEEYQQWLEPFSDESTRNNASLDCSSLVRQAAPLTAQLDGLLKKDELAQWQRLDFEEKRFLRSQNILQNNLACLIDWRSSQNGLKRLAHFIASLLRLHRFHGDRWPILHGLATAKALTRVENRHFLFLHKGNCWLLQASDGAGRTANPVQIENTLYGIVHGQHPDSSDLPFTAYSFVPEQEFQALKGQLRHSEHNREQLELVKDAWFSVALEDFHQNDLHDGLIGAAFKDYENFFSYKPISYCCNTVDERYFLHSETTWANPETLAQLLQLTQDYFDRQDFDRRNELPADLAARRLSWQLTPQLEEHINELLEDYEREADSYYCSNSDLFLTDDARHTLERVGVQPLLAIAFQYAQWRNLKTIRSVNGLQWGELNQRVQLTSREAIDLAEAIAEEEDDVKDLWQDYVAEYERRLGSENPYRYLQALELLARQRHLDIDFFHSKHYQEIPCLNISHNCDLPSLIFLPRGDNAFALSYQLRRNNIGIWITHRKKRSYAVQRYCREVKFALKQLLRLLG